MVQSCFSEWEEDSFLNDVISSVFLCSKVWEISLKRAKMKEWFYKQFYKERLIMIKDYKERLRMLTKKNFISNSFLRNLLSHPGICCALIYIYCHRLENLVHILSKFSTWLYDHSSLQRRVLNPQVFSVVQMNETTFSVSYGLHYFIPWNLNINCIYLHISYLVFSTFSSYDYQTQNLLRSASQIFYNFSCILIRFECTWTYFSLAAGDAQNN